VSHSHFTPFNIDLFTLQHVFKVLHIKEYVHSLVFSFITNNNNAFHFYRTLPSKYLRVPNI